MSPRPKGRTPSSNLKMRIIDAAWDQIALEGAAALSLRAIARSLEIAAPSIYNHFSDRDALVTELIVAAFTSFSDFQEKAISTIPETDHAKRLFALGTAYREWAVNYPERYQLIFGTPIAGYVASIPTTMPSSSRSLSFLIGVLSNAQSDGNLRVDHINELPLNVIAMLSKWRDDQLLDVRIEILFLSITIWARVHGMVSLELGNQYPTFITHAGEIFQRELENIILQTII
jgi:AcrR family transcriptional regulator